MTLEVGNAAHETADWLFSISDGRGLPIIDGLVAVENYDRSGRPPEEVAIMEKAHSYGARAVFFEAERNGRGACPGRLSSSMRMMVWTMLNSPNCTSDSGAGEVCLWSTALSPGAFSCSAVPTSPISRDRMTCRSVGLFEPCWSGLKLPRRRLVGCCAHSERHHLG